MVAENGDFQSLCYIFGTFKAKKYHLSPFTDPEIDDLVYNGVDTARYKLSYRIVVAGKRAGATACTVNF